MVDLVIDSIYKKYGTSLPWTDLALPPCLFSYLTQPSCSANLLLSGCGLGQHIADLKALGYTNITASDHSCIAIDYVKFHYPFVKFVCCKTELLQESFSSFDIVLDVHNLHQVEPLLLESYLKSLLNLANSLLIVTWIFEPEKGSIVNSDVDSFGNIWHHNPIDLLKFFPSNISVDLINYDLVNNVGFFDGEKAPVNRMVGLVISK